MRRNLARRLVCQHLLVRIVRSKSNGHLGNDTTQDSSKTLVQAQGGFLLHNVHAGFDKSAGFNLSAYESVS